MSKLINGIPEDLYRQLEGLDVAPVKTAGQMMLDGLTPTGSGTNLLSNEELARTERFYHVKRNGSFTYLGKQPDARLLSNEAVIAVSHNTGKMRVVNSSIALSDMQVIDKYGASLTKAVMESGASQVVAGTSTVYKNLIRGARKIKSLI